MHIVYLIWLQCIDQFVGNGVICGKDSDGDGYPDMMLDCDNPHCVQVRKWTYICLNALSIYNLIG